MTPDLLILRTLLPGPAHGHAIAKSIERSSSDVLQVEQGSLYPALHRLIKRGWIVAADGTSENNRRAKFYRLTPKGKKQLTDNAGARFDRMPGVHGARAQSRAGRSRHAVARRVARPIYPF